MNRRAGQRWRELALVIKAKLEEVDSCNLAFEDESLARIVLPGRDTVGAAVTPRVEPAYRTGRAPHLLAPYEPPALTS